MVRSVGVPLESGPFDLVNGLPVHPLVVHAAVVLVPLAALCVLLMAAWPTFSRRAGWLVAAGAAVAAGASFVAKESGEALEERVGEPGFDHADLGGLMPLFSAALVLVALVLWLVDRSGGEQGPRRGLRIGAAVVAAVVALATLFWVYRVGDSGAKSVWSGRVAVGEAGTDDGEPDDSPTASPSPTAQGPSPTSDDASPTGDDALGEVTYTPADVAARNTEAQCWASIDGGVYDLTSWISEHPGGAQRILDLCGTDASAAFGGQHGGQPEPAEELADLRIGSLA